MIRLAFKFVLLLCISAQIRGDDDEETDFIIVGGGTAGCVVASRLSENGKYSVTILEAGGEPGDSTVVPATFLNNVFSLGKVYLSEPQKDANLANAGLLSYVTGKVLGGTSTINAMVFNRGSPHDYDNWANKTGDQSWSYEKLLPLFRKIEDYNGKYPDKKAHGTGGPLSIQYVNYSPGMRDWLAAGEEAGYHVGDPNGPQKPGLAPIEYTKKKGRRVSAYKAYIEPHEETRENLKIITRAFVIKVKVVKCKKYGLKAVGVVYRNDDDEIVTLKAKKEVIVSCGTVDSPSVLMRSGIGPKDVLEKAKIKVLKDLPVGKNLQDHPYINVMFGVDEDKVELYHQSDLTDEARELWEETGEGPFANSYGMGPQGFMVSDVAKNDPWPGPIWPDIHYMHVQTSDPIILFAGMTPDPSATRKSIVTMVTIGRPKGFGEIRLDPKNPEGDPVIDSRLYHNEDDMQIIMDGIKILLKLFEETETMQAMNAHYMTIPHPNCKEPEFRTDDYWRCLIRQLGGCGIHMGGTVRMHRKDDPTAVVDPKLKVIGVKGLRVADLSICTDITNANPQAAAYVIGEKCAKMILDEWAKKGKRKKRHA